MARKNLNNQKGQTAVEYIFLLAVVVAVITSLFTSIKNRYIGDITKCVPGARNKQLACKINSILMDNGRSSVGKKFQYYPFKK